MFDEFGPRGAEDEREGFWTDLSEVPDEQYRDEDEPKQTQEVIVPPAQEPYGPGIVPPEEDTVKASPRGKLSPQATDEGRACGGSPYTGRRRKLAPHPASGGASATFPRGGRHVHLYLLIHQKPEPDLCRQAFTFRKPGCAVGGSVPVIGRHGEQILHSSALPA